MVEPKTEEVLLPQYFLNAVVYSKDRPYQLQQFLESFQKMVLINIECQINVLYTYSEGFKDHYDRVIH
jgi:hypothetical protein